MKVLQFGKFYPPSVGGIESVMYNLTNGLNEAGVRCDVLCSNDNYSYTEEHGYYTVYRTRSFGKLLSTSITPQLISKLIEIKDMYDIIHVHLPDPMANLALFIARPKAKIVLYWHSDIIKQKTILKFYAPLLKWLIKRADLIVGATLAHIDKSDFSHLFSGKSAVLPYPFDSSTVNSSKVDFKLLKKIKSNYLNKRIIFSVGRLVYYKGFNFLIDAAKKLPENYVVLIGGEGELYHDLVEQIIALNLSNKVKLLGKLTPSELAACYEACDLFCLPSIYRSEMFGLVQVEAMSFGKPVVATDIEKSGVKYVGIDGETGYYVAPGNASAMANAIISVFKDEAVYKAFSRRAKELVNERYVPQIVIQRLVTLYQSLL